MSSWIRLNNNKYAKLYNKIIKVVKDVITEEIGEKTLEEIEEDFKKLYIF